VSDFFSPLHIQAVTHAREISSRISKNKEDGFFYIHHESENKFEMPSFGTLLFSYSSWLWYLWVTLAVGYLTMQLIRFLLVIFIMTNPFSFLIDDANFPLRNNGSYRPEQGNNDKPLIVITSSLKEIPPLVEPDGVEDIELLSKHSKARGLERNKFVNFLKMNEDINHESTEYSGKVESDFSCSGLNGSNCQTSVPEIALRIPDVDPEINPIHFSVSSVAKIGSAYTAQIIVVLNGIVLTALLDTGAAISVIAYTMVDMLGAKILHKKSSATSVSGNPLSLVGTDSMILKMANVIRNVSFHFSDDEYFCRNASYNVIIGCDILRQFPPIVMDLARGILAINGTRISIGDHTKCAVSNAPVRILKNVVIPPNSEKWIECFIDANYRSSPDGFTIDELNVDRTKLDEQEIDEHQELFHLSVMPCVVKPVERKIIMLLTNPTCAVVALHENQKVALANELVEKDGNLLELPDWSPIAAVSEARIEVDPKFKVNYDLCEATDSEKGKLKALIEEYSDIF
jgi:hypothetical protein